MLTPTYLRAEALTIEDKTCELIALFSGLTALLKDRISAGHPVPPDLSDVLGTLRINLGTLANRAIDIQHLAEVARNLR